MTEGGEGGDGGNERDYRKERYDTEEVDLRADVLGERSPFAMAIKWVRGQARVEFEPPHPWPTS